MLLKNSDIIIEVRHPQNVSSQFITNSLPKKNRFPSMSVAGSVSISDIMAEWTMYFVIFASDSDVLLSLIMCSLRKCESSLTLH